MSTQQTAVVGTRRTDWLLSLDERAVPHREALMGMVYHLYTGTLVGNPAPVADQIMRRISSPQVGDLVVEQSSWGVRDPARRLRMFGVLLAARREWQHTDQQWEQALADGEYDEHDQRPSEQVFYVQYGPKAADVCRWTDARFIAVAAKRGFCDPPSASTG